MTGAAILADYDGTLTPGDAHAALLRYIVRARRWPLLLLLLGAPLIALLWPRCRFAAVWLIWWCATLGARGGDWRRWIKAVAARSPPLFAEAAALLEQEGGRVWIVSASPRALVRRRLHQQWTGGAVARLIGSRMGRRYGAIVPRHYCFGAAKRAALPPHAFALALSDSLSDLPLLALGEQAWLINPSARQLTKARRSLPAVAARTWSL